MSSPALPTISAVISVFNGAPYLGAALDSVLEQSPEPSAVIVVDDGSTDDTPTILGTYGNRLQVLRQDNAGLATAYNRALALATGAFITFNDADDLWPQGRIERQLAAFAADPELDIVFGHVRQFVSPELSLEDQARYAPANEVLPGAGFASLMARRSVFDRLGPLNEAAGTASIFDYTSRMQLAGLNTLMLPEVVLHRRLHAHNYGRTMSVERDRIMLSGLRQHLQRRRGAPS